MKTPVDKKELRNIYITFLEEDIIKRLAEVRGIDNRIAMEIYYKACSVSKLVVANMELSIWIISIL